MNNHKNEEPTIAWNSMPIHSTASSSFSPYVARSRAYTPPTNEVRDEAVGWRWHNYGGRRLATSGAAICGF